MKGSFPTDTDVKPVLKKNDLSEKKESNHLFSKEEHLKWKKEQKILEAKFKILLKFFSILYPKLFFTDPKKMVPLAVGIMSAIGKDLKAKKLDDAYKQYSDLGYKFLRWYTSSNSYLIAMLKGTKRYGLDNMEQELLSAHKQYAKDKLQKNLDKLRKIENKTPNLNKYIAFLSAVLKKF